MGPSGLTYVGDNVLFNLRTETDSVPEMQCFCF